MNDQRIKRVISNMKLHDLNQVLITSPISIFYLTGFKVEPGERFFALYINVNNKVKMFLNELFPLYKNKSVETFIYKDSDDPIEILKDEVDSSKCLGIDKEMPSQFLISLMGKKPNMKFVNGSYVVDEVRMVKDEDEIKLLREASRVNDKVMEDVINIIKNDKSKSEKEMCKILGELYHKYGTEEFSFYPLVEYGKNAADPHHNSDSTTLKEGDCILFDIGGITNNYCSDMTRTVFYKEPSEEYKKIYNIVLEANLAGIRAVKPGVKLCDIDKAARDVIEKAGYGKYFTHRLGHNIGLCDHEFPDVGSNCEVVARKNMVFSIEPGIYIEGKVGVRIEDLVLVTEDGCEVLNSYPKEYQVIE